MITGWDMASDTCPAGWHMVPWARSAGAVRCPTHQAWLKRSKVPGTGLGLTVVQLVMESPSGAGHAEKHLPVLPGLEATSRSPPALLGISPGLDWKKPFQNIHLLLGQKQVIADSAAAEAPCWVSVPRSPR